MNPLEPTILFDQVNDLPIMTREQLRPFDRIVRNVLTPLEFLSLRRVYLTGDGDSYQAVRAAEMAFKNIARIPCEPLSAQRFLNYGAEWIESWAPNDNLVVGISAGGRTRRVVEALEKAKAHGALTLAITGNGEGPVSQTADRTILVSLPDMGRSPGIRTYNASLMGLLLLAIRIGELKDRYHQLEANAMRQEIGRLAEVMEATIAANHALAKKAAQEFKGAPYAVYLGSGPSYGTALFSAAKIIESANEFAVGQDLEEWALVENLAYPDDTPTFVISPPGRSHWRALGIVERAKSKGRRVTAVVQNDCHEIAKKADYHFPIMGAVREEFSPLVYHIPTTLFAAYLTQALGRKIFQPDTPAFKLMYEMMAKRNNN